MKKHQITALIVGSSVAVAAGVFAGTAFAGPGCDKGAMGGDHTPGARLSQMDSDKDGKVSLSEFSTAREGWLTRVDANNDGIATRAELDASFAAGQKEHVEKRFTSEDTNKDGRLTREETRMPSSAFERADTNHDGALTLNEATSARQKAFAEKKAGKAAGPESKMGKIDTNGDGKVERQEVKAAAAQSFAHLDKNGDGSLTNEELGRHGRGHGRHRRGPGGQPGDAPAPAAPPAATRS